MCLQCALSVHPWLTQLMAYHWHRVCSVLRSGMLEGEQSKGLASLFDCNRDRERERVSLVETP